MTEKNLKEPETSLIEEDAYESDLEDRSLLIRILANRNGLAIHMFLYLSVMGLLALLWMVDRLQGTDPVFWPMHAIFGWGFAIGIHVITYIMYNDMNKTLSKIRRKSDFGVLFIYHALIYGMVNLYLFLINIIYAPGFLWFFWPLAMWGIGVGVHALGFSKWDKMFQKNLNKLQEKYKAEEYRDDYPEQKLRKMTNKKLSHFWLLVAHIFYFIVVNVLLFSFQILEGATLNFLVLYVDSILTWGVYLGLHAFAYVLFYNVDMKPVVKGLVLNIVLFAITLGMNFYRYLSEPFPIMWMLYMIILWGIVIGIHAYVVVKWDSYKEKIEQTITTISTTDGLDLESFEVGDRASTLLFWKWSFIAHLAIYAVGLGIIYLELVNAGEDITLLLHPAMGWLIAVAVHGAIYLSVRIQTLGFFAITATIHLAVYTVTVTYMILLNMLYSPQYPWSLIAAMGWGIGLGLHLLLAFLTRRP